MLDGTQDHGNDNRETMVNFELNIIINTSSRHLYALFNNVLNSTNMLLNRNSLLPMTSFSVQHLLSFYWCLTK